MKQPFQLPVSYKGETILMQAELQSWGFGQRVIVEVDNKPIRFERDAQRNYRPVAEAGQMFGNASLIYCVIKTLEFAFK